MFKDKNYKVKDFAGWTIAIFGGMAVILGISGLLNPEFILSTLGFEIVPKEARPASDFTLAFVTISSMASLNMGIYYVFAALNDLKIFYRWTVPFRTLTFIIFTSLVLSGSAPTRFLGIGAWELFGAILTGIALYIFDKNKKGE